VLFADMMTRCALYDGEVASASQERSSCQAEPGRHDRAEFCPYVTVALRISCFQMIWPIFGLLASRELGELCMLIGPAQFDPPPASGRWGEKPA
jgi:hypothetical protein